MNIYKPSELQALLKEWGVSAKKGLSQNFLIDQNVILKILKMADIQPGDHVVEIGPGPGALTEALLKQHARVTAIEMDPIFAKALHRLQTPENGLRIIQSDFLKLSLQDYTTPAVPVKIVANLPYHITTPILTRLLPLYPSITTLTIMVQKEFAARMAATVGSADYSSLTVFLNFYAAVLNHFTVSPNSFYPRPKVHSSVVHCRLHAPALPAGQEKFFLLTRTAFQQRRKMLRGSLKELLPSEKVESALTSLHLNPQARPEELSLEAWIAFFNCVSYGLGDDKNNT